MSISTPPPTISAGRPNLRPIFCPPNIPPVTERMVTQKTAERFITILADGTDPIEQAHSDGESVDACRDGSDDDVPQPVQVMGVHLVPHGLEHHRPAHIKQQEESDQTRDPLHMTYEYVAEHPAQRHQGRLHDTEHDGDRNDTPPRHTPERDAGASRDRETIGAEGGRQKQRLRY